MWGDHVGSHEDFWHGMLGNNIAAYSICGNGCYFLVGSGSLFFKQGTHLHLQEGAVLKGSDRIRDFEIRETRIEGRRASTSWPW